MCVSVYEGLLVGVVEGVEGRRAFEYVQLERGMGSFHCRRSDCGLPSHLRAAAHK